MTDDERSHLRAAAVNLWNWGLQDECNAIDRAIDTVDGLTRANAELTARAEKAEKESERLRAMLASGAVGCLDRRPETPTQAKDE